MPEIYFQDTLILYEMTINMSGLSVFVVRVNLCVFVNKDVCSIKSSLSSWMSDALRINFIYADDVRSLLVCDNKGDVVAQIEAHSWVNKKRRKLFHFRIIVNPFLFYLKFDDILVYLSYLIARRTSWFECFGMMSATIETSLAMKVDKIYE